MSDPLTTPGDTLQALREGHGRDFYSNVLEERSWREVQMSWKETCYIGSWSFLPDLHVEGPDAMQLFSDLSVNSFENMEVGNAKQAVMCNRDGKVIGDSVLMRTGEEKFHHQNIAPWTQYHAEQGDYDVDVHVHDSAIWQVQGPNALAVMESVTDHDLRSIDFMNVEKIDIQGHEVWAVRQGMSGEIGFELQMDHELSDTIFDIIYEAGQEHGIIHLVGKTRLINHLESCFPTAGLHYLPAIYEDHQADYREYLAQYDEGRDWTPWGAFNRSYAIEGSYPGEEPSDYYCSPYELGWGRNVKFDHDFIGREALEAEEASGPPRKMVTLEWNREDVSAINDSFFTEGDHHKFMEMPYKPIRVLQADGVYNDDGELIGMSSGRGYSYYFRRMLSLCTIDAEYADHGSEVTIEWGEGQHPDSPTVEPHEPKAVRATVANAPYKEDRRHDI